MAIPGKEIFHCHDRFGQIQVFDDGNKRYLAFGNDDEQSCLLKNAPSHLQYDYTRTMLLPLVFQAQQPQTNNSHILLLGLGGGSLANCLLNLLPSCQITAIELRQTVVDIAYQYFELPKSKRLNVVTGDAKQFIKNDRQQYRLIFSDIYSADGIDNAQVQIDYLAYCLQLLTTGGWLVLNFWREHRGNERLLAFLKSQCQEVRIATTASGNWIVLASKHSQAISPKQLLGYARQLSEQLGFSLLPSLKKLQAVDR